jgi:SecD/SecF fusion protein
MSKNATSKVVLITALVVVVAFLLLASTVGAFFVAKRILSAPVDTTGGTSLVYEIDTRGLTEQQKKGLSERMIRVLRRRIDPSGRMPLVWQPLGDSRFEVQIPPPRPTVRQKRLNYEVALGRLLAANITRATILRCLEKPAEERTQDFEDFARGEPDRLRILESLARAHDERNGLEDQIAELDEKLKASEDKISSAGLDIDQIRLTRNDWVRLNEQELGESLRESAGSEDNVSLLTGYIETYARWIKVVERLTDPITGKRIQYEEALRAADQLNLTADRMTSCLEMRAESSRRRQAIEQLKTEFPDRAQKIDIVVAAFDECRPFRGRLDDAKDLQRMLKGAGVLEFRILPTTEDADVDELANQVELLKTMGPKFGAEASDGKYVWCEIENTYEWNVPGSVVAPFGDKSYVLASDRPNEAVLHSPGERGWKLERAYPTTDNMGRRAVGFVLDEKGGTLFGNVTGSNIDRLLCILLDGIAMSAPMINTRVGRQGIITGSFTQMEVEEIVNRLNAGSLPAPLIEEPVSVRTIGEPTDADESDKDAESERNLSEGKL